ncbi:MAG: polysaccharide biosynthesis/export family protein [Phycisphaerae bacterium]|nr:polysaccharide biosynthesis/export family protein [Phycisphaerae bacterium]
MSDSLRRPDTDRRARPWRHDAWVPMLTFAFASLIAAGCADPRISIHEFVEMQQDAAAQPTTQPSDRTFDVWAKHAFVPYRAGPSDVLGVALTGLNEPTETIVLQARVNRDGEISLPMVGTVNVGDRELEDVERAIEAAYVPAIVKAVSVNVEVVSYHTTDVLVTGAVTTPGLIPLRRTQRDLLHAVANAGGVSYDASGQITLKRVRRPAEGITLNVLDPIELEAAFSLEPLESGDVILVEAATPNQVFVGGLVRAPGPKLFPRGTQVNLLQVLASSGGVATEVAPSEATLIRRMPDGRDVQVKLDLDRLQRGEDPNIMLAAGDILWVPETIGTRTVDFFNRNIFFRAGFTASYNVTGNATGIEWLNRRSRQSGAFSQGATNGGNTIQNMVDPFGFLFP